MGLSSSVSAAFITLLILTGSAYLVSINLDLMRTTTEPFAEYMEAEYARVEEDCTIDSWLNTSSTSLKVNITNSGETGILVRDFDTIDIIIAYRAASGDKVIWLPYDQDGGVSRFWNISGVYTNDDEGDYLNPISLSGDVHGIWDSGESIEITCVYEDSVIEYYYFKVILPYGKTILYLN
jgi:archaellum component FlaF (FlaF/FlaG flagellin family)